MSFVLLITHMNTTSNQNVKLLGSCLTLKKNFIVVKVVSHKKRQTSPGDYPGDLRL